VTEIAAILSAELTKRNRANADDFGDDVFDPWVLFPAIYGSYYSEFGETALHVLRNLIAGKHNDEGLAHEIFREMLCVSGVCDYGINPRGCFLNSEYRAIIEAWVKKMEAHERIYWGD
jgi:hypothetical protein